MEKQVTKEIKLLAKKVQKTAKDLGYDMKLNHALELIARTNFNQTWHVVSKRDDILPNVLTDNKQQHDEIIKKDYSDLITVNSITKNINFFGKESYLFGQIKYNSENVVKFLKEYYSNNNESIVGISEDFSYFYTTKIKGFNSLFDGGMGSGKTHSAAFFLINLILKEINQPMIFMYEPIIGLEPIYDGLRRCSNNHFVDSESQSEKIELLMDTILDESFNSIFLIEDYQAMIYSINESDDKTRIMNKFIKILDSSKVNVICVGQNRHPDLLKYFHLKFIFKTNKENFEKFLNYEYKEIDIKQQGQCYSNLIKEKLKFPLINAEEFKELLDFNKDNMIIKKQNNSKKENNYKKLLIKSLKVQDRLNNSYCVFGKKNNENTVNYIKMHNSAGLYLHGSNQAEIIKVLNTTILSYLMMNENVMGYIFDLDNSCKKYRQLINNSNLESVIHEKDVVEKINNIYDELVERKKTLALNNLVDLYKYKNKTSTVLDTCLIVFNNLDSLLPVLDSVKDKLKEIMRIGRSYGIYFFINNKEYLAEMAFFVGDNFEINYNEQAGLIGSGDIEHSFFYETEQYEILKNRKKEDINCLVLRRS